MSIKQIQQALAAAGFDPGPIDGVNGPKTKAAIRAFQKARGLAVDGIVGPRTTAALQGSGGGQASNGIDSEAAAQQYGFSMALLNTDQELKNLFNQAVAGTWTTDRFTAALRNTNWYKNNGEAVRQALVLKTSDPATYAQGLDGSTARVRQFAAAMGASLDGGTLSALSETAYQMGWDDNQLREHLTTYVQWTDGRMLGQAGTYADQLKEYARSMGVTASDSFIQTQIQSVMGGRQTIDDVMGMLREQAVSAYPQLAERLRAGETVADVASPYGSPWRPSWKWTRTRSSSRTSSSRARCSSATTRAGSSCRPSLTSRTRSARTVAGSTPRTRTRRRRP